MCYQQHYVDGESDRPCARSEVERRGKYVKEAEQAIGEKHSLVVTMKKCLNLNASKRPSAKQLVSILNKILKSLPEKYLVSTIKINNYNCTVQMK